MVLVAVMLSALLAGGGVALYLQLQSTKSASLTKSRRTTLYCAEAGITEGQIQITSQSSLWPALLDEDAGNDPPWYPIVGDIDGDGRDDYRVTIADNDDETVGANDPTVDRDSRVFLISRCLKDPEVPRTVRTLIDVAASGHNYRNQAGGGAGNTGNQN
jgi:hypothetical protein